MNYATKETLSIVIRALLAPAFYAAIGTIVLIVILAQILQ